LDAEPVVDAGKQLMLLRPVFPRRYPGERRLWWELLYQHPKPPPGQDAAEVVQVGTVEAKKVGLDRTAVLP